MERPFIQVPDAISKVRGGRKTGRGQRLSSAHSLIFLNNYKARRLGQMQQIYYLDFSRLDAQLKGQES